VNCCFKSEMPQPLLIEPRRTIDYICELRIISPGPFETEITIFVYGARLENLPITVRGVGVADERPTHEQSNP
jgi:hypothetical protein